MGSDQHVYVSDRQVDMDGRIYLLESAMIRSADVRPAHEVGISSRDEDGDVDLWVAGDEAFEELQDEGRRRIARREREAEDARQAAQQAALVDALVARLGPLLPGASMAPSVEGFVSTEKAAQILKIDRSTLDEMVGKAPRELPGAPVHVGEGTERRHLRWEAARLPEWMAAYRAWKATRGKRKTK